LAASNVAGVISGFGAWTDQNDMLPFLGDNPPKAAPSIVNSSEVNLVAFSA